MTAAWPQVLALGSAQTLAWASSFYLPALLAAPQAAELGLGTATVFAAFSLALLAAGAVSPLAGRHIDRHGGRGLLMASNGLFALGLVALAAVQGPWGLFGAWLLLGLAMGCGLYEAAFASLVRLHGHASRDPITGITLIAGFASTVGWPLTALMLEAWGWRGACLGWAALHLVLGLPLNARLPRAAAQAPAAAPATPAGAPPATAAAAAPRATHPLLLLAALAFVFATTRFVASAIGVHLPALLMAAGSTLAGAVAVGMLVGPAQVAGRLAEFGLLRRVHPLISARLAALGHPLAALALLALGPVAAPAFALLHGAGNGVLTIAKGMLPLALFGPAGYGQRQGWLALPSLAVQAAAPWLFGLALQAWGDGALWLSFGVALVALAVLMAVRRPAAGG